MTEPRHFHSARKGSGSLRPFPIYPLYTQAEILSLDKPIADCFLFRLRKSCKKRKKRSHSKAFSTSGNTSGTNGSRSFQGTAAGTHLPSPTGSHTADHRAKQGRFGRGVVSLPSDRFARFGNPVGPGIRTAYFAAFWPWSGVLPKNAESLRDSDALMRVAVPRRRGPAGLRDLVAVPLTVLIGFTILLSRIVAHRKLSACSLVTAVRFLNRCSRRSMRETYPLGQRSGCRF